MPRNANESQLSLVLIQLIRSKLIDLIEVTEYRGSGVKGTRAHIPTQALEYYLPYVSISIHYGFSRVYTDTPAVSYSLVFVKIISIGYILKMIVSVSSAVRGLTFEVSRTK